MNINERITKVIEYSKLTPSEFADEIDVQRSSISHITSGRNKPSLEFITKVKTSFPDIEWEWLIIGEGTMIKEKIEIIEEKQEEIPPKKSLPDLFSMIDDDSFGLVESDDKTPKSNVLDSVKTDIIPERPIIIDSQRLEEKAPKTEIAVPKGIKRIVFFYEDGSFETFQN